MSAISGYPELEYPQSSAHSANVSVPRDSASLLLAKMCSNFVVCWKRRRSYNKEQSRSPSRCRRAPNILDIEPRHGRKSTPRRSYQRSAPADVNSRGH